MNNYNVNLNPKKEFKLPSKMTSQLDDKSLKHLGSNILTKYILCISISMTF
jgi:hypothetical protein